MLTGPKAVAKAKGRRCNKKFKYMNALGLVMIESKWELIGKKLTRRLLRKGKRSQDSQTQGVSRGRRPGIGILNASSDSEGMK